jgi:hypothetical protein
MKATSLFFLLFVCCTVRSQIPDHIYYPSIHTVKLYKSGDIYSYPVLTLNGADRLDLQFDDLEGDVKTLYYTYQLCNADWTPSSLFSYDYIRGFQSVRINTYRSSSLATVRYTHYEASVPDRNSVPTRSGNYLLKVFRNNDTSAILFTKRFLVVDNKIAIAAHIRQPFRAQLLYTDHRVLVTLNTANARLNTLSPQDLKIAVLQNYSWTTAAHVNRPSIYRGDYYEYNDDATSFPAGREWRWIDLRSLRLMSERMMDLHNKTDSVNVYVKPDVERRSQSYLYYRDLNGLYTIENRDGNNPLWQSDYAWVHFTYVPPGNQAYPGRDVYLYGELTNYLPNDASRMEFNTEKGVYEKVLYLKQGYYNYSYITLDAKGSVKDRFSFENTEGNFSNTENDYMVLVYYRPFGARADELIGLARLNSLIR